jgi:hypothetical protein
MARTISRAFGQSRPFICNQKQIRNPVVRAAVLDAPNAVPDELNAEMEDQAGMYAQFDELLKGTVTAFKQNDEVRGTVVDVSRRGAYVDIGGKGAAFVATENLCCAPVADVRSECCPKTLCTC